MSPTPGPVSPLSPDQSKSEDLSETAEAESSYLCPSEESAAVTASSVPLSSEQGPSEALPETAEAESSSVCTSEESDAVSVLDAPPSPEEVRCASNFPLRDPTAALGLWDTECHQHRVINTGSPPRHLHPHHVPFVPPGRSPQLLPLRFPAMIRTCHPARSVPALPGPERGVAASPGTAEGAASSPSPLGRIAASPGTPGVGTSSPSSPRGAVASPGALGVAASPSSPLRRAANPPGSRSPGGPRRARPNPGLRHHRCPTRMWRRSPIKWHLRHPPGPAWHRCSPADPPSAPGCPGWVPAASPPAGCYPR